MGVDPVRVVCGPVDEELICPICSLVLFDPVQVPECEHAFCSPCILTWLSTHPTCPVDRSPIPSASSLQPAARILRNMLNRLEVQCENASLGCNVVTRMELLSSHQANCEHDPDRRFECEQGCGAMMQRDQLNEHSCVRELRRVVDQREQQLREARNEISECRAQIDEQWREINLLKESVKSLRVSRSTSLGPNRTVTSHIRQEEINAWASTLNRARVTRWGGMISTPDKTLQTLIQRSLADSACPSHILDELMANSHERRWPPGLLSLETRQNNRRQYEQYFCRRIPNRQAVVVMAADNMHMSDDMIAEPGLVMIFAHGIE